MWPFSKKPPTVAVQAGAQNSGQHAKRDGTFLYVPALDYFGFYKTSPNERYTVSWIGSRQEGDTHRDGQVMLIHGDRVVARIHAESPQAGYVTDQGTFAFMDWLNNHDLSSQLCVYRGDGALLLQHRFAANMFTAALAPDGRHAACQLANSNSPEDSGMLCCFDLDSARLSWRVPPTPGWPNNYRFDPTHNALWVSSTKGPEWAFSLSDGRFLDQVRWERSIVKSEPMERVAWVLKGLMGDAGTDMARSAELQGTLDLAATRWPDDPAFLAKVERYRGELHERNGDSPNAIAAYQRAVSLNGKIGLKKRIAELKAKQSQ